MEIAVPPSRCMSLTASSRIHYFIDYPGGNVPVRDILKLGTSYKVAQLNQNTASHPIPERLKYKPGQRVDWKSLPLDVRLIIYDYVYADAYGDARHGRGPGKVMLITSFKYTRYVDPDTQFSSTTDYPNDDVQVALPHALADRFVSKQWLLETASAMTKSGHWQSAFCEGRTWRLAVQILSQPWTPSTLTALNQGLCSMMFSMATYVFFVIQGGGDLVDYFGMDDFQISRRFEYIRVIYFDLVVGTFWIRSSRGDDANDIDAAADLMIASSITASTNRERAITLPQHIVDGIVDMVSSVPSQMVLLPPAIWYGLVRWTAQNRAYQRFKAMFNDWRGPEPEYRSEFILESSCMIEGNPEQVLTLDTCLLSDGRIYVSAAEVSSRRLGILESFEQSAPPSIADSANKGTIETIESATTGFEEQAS